MKMHDRFLFFWSTRIIDAPNNMKEHIMPSHNGRRRSERCSMSLVALCAAVILLIITFASDVMFLLRPSQVLPTSDSFLTTTSNTETAMARMPAKNFEIAIERGENVLLEPPDDAFAMEIPKPSQITEGLHISSPPHEGICSCWNLTATQCCSERRIHPNHKFGHVLVTKLFAEGSFYHMDGMAKGMLTGNFRKDYFNRSDYREVFIIRNWFDAIVSGYLYHKSGRECWLDDYGNPLVDTRKHHWKLANPDFIDLIRPELGPFPEGRGRDLCHYLAEESEETGIRVFAEYVVRKFYFRAVQIWTAVQRLEDPYHRKTLFLCFEDLSNPATKQNEIQKIMSWLYPGGQYDDLPPLPQGEEQKKEQLLQQQRREREDLSLSAQATNQKTQENGNLTEYNGGHATSKDPEQLKRLREIVVRIDQKQFHGTIAKYQALFRCQKRR